MFSFIFPSTYLHGSIWSIEFIPLLNLKNLKFHIFKKPIPRCYIIMKIKCSHASLSYDMYSIGCPYDTPTRKSSYKLYSFHTSISRRLSLWYDKHSLKWINITHVGFCDYVFYLFIYFFLGEREVQGREGGGEREIIHWKLSWKLIAPLL